MHNAFVYLCLATHKCSCSRVLSPIAVVCPSCICLSLYDPSRVFLGAAASLTRTIEKAIEDSYDIILVGSRDGYICGSGALRTHGG